DEAMRLRDQLKFEFFFPDKLSYRAQLSAELERLDPGWETADGRSVLERSQLLVASRVLRSFVDAQLVVAERLGARPVDRPVVEKEFLDECGGVGRQMLLQGLLHGPESLSRELFSGALKLAANLDLIDPGGGELAQRRRAFARHHLRSAQVAPADLGRMLLTGLRGVSSEEDFERFTAASMRVWAGRSEDELAELGERLWVQGLAGALYPEAWRLVEAHLRAG